MHKIYLSKSNKATNIDFVKKLILSTCDCEIIEHMPGTTYDITKIDQCDYFIVVIPKFPFVGRGVYSEIEHAIKRIPCYVYHDEAFPQIEKIGIFNEHNWQDNYGTIDLKEGTFYFVG